MRDVYAFLAALHQEVSAPKSEARRRPPYDAVVLDGTEEGMTGTKTWQVLFVVFFARARLSPPTPVGASIRLGG